MLCAHANFEVNTRSIYARNYDFLSVALKKISTVCTTTLAGLISPDPSSATQPVLA